jgi:hypothetical protein
VAVRDGDSLPLALDDAVGEPDRLPLAEAETLLVADCEAVCDGDTPAVWLAVIVPLSLGVLLPVRLLLAVTLALAVSDELGVCDVVAPADFDADEEAVFDGVWLEERVLEPVSLAVCVLEPLPVVEADCDAVTLTVAVELAVRVTLELGVEETELVCEPVFVTVRLPLALLVGVAVRDPLEEGVEVLEGDEVCRREAEKETGQGSEGVRQRQRNGRVAGERAWKASRARHSLFNRLCSCSLPRASDSSDEA